MKSSARSDLAVDYSSVARFKLGSYKSTYRLGDLVVIDLALLNVANYPIYFFRTDYALFSLFDERDQEIKIYSYGEGCHGLSPGLFELREAKSMTSHSIQMLVGCDGKAFQQQTGEATDEEVFDQNRFLNYGSACLNITQTGTYKIKARQRNDNVIEDLSEPEAKTAIGSTESEALIIKIVE